MNLGWNIAPEQYRSLDPPLCSPMRYHWATAAPQESQQKEPMIQHTIPSVPWSKVGSDIFYLNGQQNVLITDYTTKYAVIRRLPEKAPASAVILMHRRVFGEMGIPQEIVSDQGPQYKAEEFVQFCKEWGIKHTYSSPTYAQSNGEVERAIKTVKSILKKTSEAGEDTE